MKVVKVKSLAANRIKKGYPALESYDFKDRNEAEEGDLLKIVDTAKRFVALGYLGDEKKTAGWVLSLDEKTIIDDQFFEDLFEKAKTKRSAFYADDLTTAFRFFNGEGDGLGGLTIDNYDGYYVFSWYSEGIYKFKKTILKAFKAVVPEHTGIFEKLRYPNPPVKSRFVEGKEVESVVIKENGIRYKAYLNDGWMTGLFLDQRNVRRRIMEDWGMGRKVLNAFSYTGAFSVAAAMGGALKTVNVDVANRSKERTEEQFELNGLSTENHEIRVMDVFDYLDYAKKHKLLFDLIVLDPPTFARTKKRTFSVDTDYTELVKDALDVLATNGILITATNSWGTSRDDFFEMVNDALEEKDVDAYLMDEQDLPEDFAVSSGYPEGHYLKVFVLERTK
ncbi:MAG: class I SAM-dependent rRNA methyltransferase [Alkalibacterium sp.]|nr:class I SAM-dependent rRNA methyltransferase [Alkalibacterium sp.]TVP91180.1 MAG: class I SAM-dependent rRNA methyltransferase [Alkalibacterium sp.]